MRVLSSSELSSLLASMADGATVALSGAGSGLLEPEAVFQHFESTFLSSGRPRNLTLVHALGLGNRKDTGTNRFAYEGMVKRVIGGHSIWSPRMLRLAQENKIEAYSLPSGAIANLFREIGAKRPGLFTHVGLGTFVDPRLGGGRCNEATKEDIVELIQIDGRDVLRYRPFPVDVAVVRGTFADSLGDISASEEPADLDGVPDVIRQIVARRAAMELVKGATINFGFGMSSGVAEQIVREGKSGDYWFTIEQGIHGGDLLTGDMFGIAANPTAILSASEQFDLYATERGT